MAGSGNGKKSDTGAGIGCLVLIGVLVLLWFVAPKWVFWVSLVVGIIVLGILFGSDDKTDYDALLAEKLKVLRERALKKLGLEEEEISETTPIELAGYNVGSRVLHDPKLDSTDNEENPKTHQWQGPEAFLSGFYFTADRMAVYQWRVSLVSDNSREMTEEVYYDDIVSVKMDSEEIPILNSKTGEDTGRRARYDSFSLTTKGADRIVGFGPSDQLQSAVSAMRALLREKKRG